MIYSKQFLTATIPLLLIFSLAACQPSSQRDSVRKSDLVGTKWQLIKLTHQSEVIEFSEDIAPFIEFRDDLVGGNSGCNTYRSGWQLGQDGKFALSGPISQTRKGCLNTVMGVENKYIDVFRESHTIVLSDDTLIISSTSGELIFADAK